MTHFMIELRWLVLILPLYAEIHYRFKWFPFSRYFRREPEIIADAPFRLEPGMPLPVLLLIKDAHQYPIHLHSVTFTGKDEAGNTLIKQISQNLVIDRHWWYQTVELDPHNLMGKLSLEVSFDYTINGKRRMAINHNLPGSPEKPLTINLADQSLPGSKRGWYWGDLHTHTSLTEDQVEFGAPLEATQKAANACGLSFVCLTDHSYDLDDKMDSWYETDPDLQKWHDSRNLLKNLNENAETILVAGEELSSGNSRGKNIHILLLNWPEFIPGAGDGAERWFNTDPDYQTTEIVEHPFADGLAIAAHTRMQVPFLQKLLLKRGQWETDDHNLPNLTGFQVLNGSFNDDFNEGIHYWIKSLLKGQTKYIYAGNDAHGNFNRFRQIKFPMISIWDHTDQILGKCRTGIFLKNGLSLPAILQALRQGCCVISNGPLMEISIKTSKNNKSYTLGEYVNGNNISISLTCSSSKEFGNLDNFELLLGDLGSAGENQIIHFNFNLDTYTHTEVISYNVTGIRGYIRGRATSKDKEGNCYHCYTNPVWINHPAQK